MNTGVKEIDVEEEVLNYLDNVKDGKFLNKIPEICEKTGLSKEYVREIVLDYIG